MSLYRNFLSVGALTLLSRIAGFARDALMAAVLGTGPAADAFFAAFRFPNLFRRLFAEGAFNTAFVPMFSGALEQDGPDQARLLAARIMSWLVAALVVVTILAEIFMPTILVPFVPGFDDPAKFELTVLLTRIMFPYLMCMSLMAAYGAILNSLGRFFAAAFAPVILNIVNISAMIPLVTFAVQAPADAAVWVAIATMFGGVAQLALVYWSIRRANFVPRFQWPRIDREVRRFWTLAIPAILTGGITQINLFVGTVIASSAAGAIAILNYADRLYQLPLGIIGIAIGTVLLPELSRHLKGNRAAEARASQDQALLVSMLLSMPAAAALVALAEPIVRLLFERGAFTELATIQTANALVAFAVGLPAYVLIRVLQPGYFAREDTMTPTIFAGISAATNIGISLLLFPSLLHVGIAIATSVSAWLNALLLAIFLARRGHFALTASEWRRHLAIIIIACLMGGALYALAQRGAGFLASGQPLLMQAAALASLMLYGVVMYFVLVHFSRVQPLGLLLRRLRRT
ncbi:murein biosynthesis integral membrane protein MurJ [Devosia rhodophyticola]|uniref:Probable lipid II flippase MurJ n=1 Tax=Devosia rhodophyticola TaxID=3026423 RepID=A0ABY7Z1J1_9HYPH|nr:murein biosynthesis integral membrane protein MurJ [Devosia rhodophyticola]WDR07324.1 murein biosynthesis integral membrane protein MurJ [Devosia rhodophyticola]